MNEDELDKVLEADDKEWDGVFDDFGTEAGLKKAEDEDADKDKPAGAEGEEADADKDKKTEGEEGAEGEDADKDKGAEGEEPPAKSSDLRDARATQREIEADKEAMANDVYKAINGDLDRQLKDADGDPINTIEDVMGLKNSVTGKNFTQEEAALWLMQAQSYRNTQVDNAIKEAEQIAEVNLDLRDEAKAVKDKFGAFLAKPENHKLRDEVLADFKATLVTRGQGDDAVIVKAPNSMLRFYERAVGPSLTAVSATATAEEVARKAAEDKAEADRKHAEETAKLKTRSDREDIYAKGGDNKGTLSKEDQEWETAKKDYFN